MANKVALTTSFLLALVVLARASRYTTIITTTTLDDEANPRGQQQQCQRQLQGRQFRSCQSYLSQRGSSQYEEEEKEEMGGGLEMNPSQQQQYLRDCCEQLQNVEQQCRCEAIQHAARQAQQQQGSGRQQSSEQVYQRARELPRQCNFRQQCQFQVVFV